MTTPKPLKIDFVSDIACPWCAIGLASLDQALERLEGEIAPSLSFHPFELNPGMGAEGQDVSEHLTQKYGSTPELQASIRETIRQRGEAVGFTFRKEGRGRVWNTFDAHRLLTWAATQSDGAQKRLKRALLEAYHGRAENPQSREVLLAAARQAGLDEAAAAQVIDSGAYGDEVRASERFYQQNGIHSVPAVIINDRHLISGGQPPEIFERALRQIAAEAA